MQAQSMQEILAPLRKDLGIDFLTYARYHNDNVHFFSTDTNDLSAYLADEQSQLPGYMDISNQLMDWSDYCSSQFLNYCSTQLDYSPSGVTLVLHHPDTSEHISLGTTNRQLDLRSLLQFKPGLKHKILTYVRTQINQNRKRFTPVIAANKKKNRADQINNNVIPFSKTTLSHEYVYGANGETFLTRAEKNVLLHILELCSAKEIGSKLNISAKTVESHTANIRQKLGVRSKHDMYKIAIQNHLV